MKYTETPTSKLLKRTNELIHKKVGSLLSTKSKNVRESITKEIELLNKEADFLTRERAKEIGEERYEIVFTYQGVHINKGAFIDTQIDYELDDEETKNFFTILIDNNSLEKA